MVKTSATLPWRLLNHWARAANCGAFPFPRTSWGRTSGPVASQVSCTSQSLNCWVSELAKQDLKALLLGDLSRLPVQDSLACSTWTWVTGQTLPMPQKSCVFTLRAANSSGQAQLEELHDDAFSGLEQLKLLTLSDSEKQRKGKGRAADVFLPF